MDRMCRGQHFVALEAEGVWITCLCFPGGRKGHLETLHKVWWPAYERGREGQSKTEGSAGVRKVVETNRCHWYVNVSLPRLSVSVVNLTWRCQLKPGHWHLHNYRLVGRPGAVGTGRYVAALGQLEELEDGCLVSKVIKQCSHPAGVLPQKLYSLSSVKGGLVVYKHEVCVCVEFRHRFITSETRYFSCDHPFLPWVNDLLSLRNFISRAFTELPAL